MKRSIQQYFVKIDANAASSNQVQLGIEEKKLIDENENKSDDESDQSECEIDEIDIIEPHCKKKKKSLQTYTTKWEQLSVYKSWLSKSSKGIYYGRCKACDKDLKISNSGRTALDVHMASRSHQMLISEIKTNSQPELNFSNKIPMDRLVRHLFIKI